MFVWDNRNTREHEKKLKKLHARKKKNIFLYRSIEACNKLNARYIHDFKSKLDNSRFRDGTVALYLYVTHTYRCLLFSELLLYNNDYNYLSLPDRGGDPDFETGSRSQGQDCSRPKASPWHHCMARVH